MYKIDTSDMSDKDLKKLHKAQEAITEKLLKAVKSERKKTVKAIVRENEKVLERIAALEELLLQKVDAVALGSNTNKSPANTTSLSSAGRESAKSKPAVSEVSFVSPEFPSLRQNPDLPKKEKSKDFDARDARGILKKFKSAEEIDKFLLGEVRKTVIKEGNIAKEALPETE